MNQDQLQTKFSIIPDSNLRHGIMLFILAVVMFAIRTIPLHALIFTSWPGPDGNYVNFAADDAVYHMRLIHNTLHHLPIRIFYDPFTYFPYGSINHFGPLFTLIIAYSALLIGLGHPSAELVNHVAAYIPPIMGALCILPTYFISRKLFGKPCGILSAFVLTILPSEFLSRSTLGYVDHHIAETLFSAITCALFIYALSNTQATEQKKLNLFPILAGLAYGLYLLCWKNAVYFGFIFLIFFIIQLTINHLRQISNLPLKKIALPFFTLPALMVLPYALANLSLKQLDYSLTIPTILLAMLLIVYLCYYLESILNRNHINKKIFPLLLILLVLATVIIVKLFIPQLYEVVFQNFKSLLDPFAPMKTVSELRSAYTYDPVTGKISFQLLWLQFFWALPLAICALILLVYRIIKYHQSYEIFFFIWSVGIFIATLSELRFSYYLAVNIAILAGYFVYATLEFLATLNPKIPLLQSAQKISVTVLTIVVMSALFFPMLSLLLFRGIPSGAHITEDWYNTLIWLRTHTPDPQGKPIQKNFDYAAGIYHIPKITHTKFSYPSSAYGIMSWWDYGHQITYIAHRIPNASPFQDGIVEPDRISGAAPFFTATNETSAIHNLNNMGSRYVLIDLRMPTSIFGAIATWNNDAYGWRIAKTITANNHKPSKRMVYVDAPKFENSVINRLFYHDGNGLHYFRLIYESDGNYTVTGKGLNLQSNQEFSLSATFKNYAQAITYLNHLKQRPFLDKAKNLLLFETRAPEKNAKIFEKVRGATISGRAADGSNISLSLQLETKYGRKFIYAETVIAKNGHYNFIVPYPTEKMYGDGYEYDIMPITKYSLNTGNKVIEVSVPEKAVMQGSVINIEE
ncbi:MAG: oligosaccharyl transferase, archaeosortase A system-associated [Gammaproteobacteria bacterium]|nr:oligosaccharyl transferase, archaeosortase A system-associated [Gammaproteobacteria bacterium]